MPGVVVLATHKLLVTIFEDKRIFNFLNLHRLNFLIFAFNIFNFLNQICLWISLWV